MPRGGNRHGAGRPKGQKTTNGEGLALAAKPVTPLVVMEKAMLEHYEAQRWDEAARIARDMAPYVHRKLAPEVPREERGLPLRLVEVLVIVDGYGNPFAEGEPAAIGLPPQ